DVIDRKALQAAFRTRRQFLNDIDRVNALDELCGNGRLIARAGADFQHEIARTQLENVRHQRDDVRLGDRLVETDGQRTVEIGIRLQLDGDEFVARQTRENFHHRGTEYSLAGVRRGQLRFRLD